MKSKYAKTQGFTLIELLVVMTIIAVLAGVGFSAFTKARETANKTNAIQNMSGNIKNALMGYASDNNDNYPDKQSQGEASAPTTSNDAFRKMIQSGYMTDEKAFAVRGTPSASGNDGDTSSATVILEKEENHYAMGKDLTLTSNANYPLVWEAGSSGDDTYAPQWMKANRSEWGGSWSDGSVLIMTVGGGVTSKKLDLAPDAAAGEEATIQKDGTETLFTLRSKASTTAAGLTVDK